MARGKHTKIVGGKKHGGKRRKGHRKGGRRRKR